MQPISKPRIHAIYIIFVQPHASSSVCTSNWIYQLFELHTLNSLINIPYYPYIYIYVCVCVYIYIVYPILIIYHLTSIYEPTSDFPKHRLCLGSPRDASNHRFPRAPMRSIHQILQHQARYPGLAEYPQRFLSLRSGKSPCLIGKSTVNGPFSMLRVSKSPSLEILKFGKSLRTFD